MENNFNISQLKIGDNGLIIDNFYSDLFLTKLFYETIIHTKLTPSFSNNRYGYPNYLEYHDLLLGAVLFDRKLKFNNFINNYDNSFPVYHSLFKALEDQILGKTYLLTAQLNLQMIGMDCDIHRDSDNDEDYTCLIMANPKWGPDYGGELEFYDNERNLIQTIDYVPGRVVVFQSKTHHKGRFPNLKGVPRYVIVFRYINMKDYIQTLQNYELRY